LHIQLRTPESPAKFRNNGGAEVRPGTVAATSAAASPLGARGNDGVKPDGGLRLAA
jgi:hypothetical protein